MPAVLPSRLAAPGRTGRTGSPCHRRGLNACATATCPQEPAASAMQRASPRRAVMLPTSARSGFHATSPRSGNPLQVLRVHNARGLRKPRAGSLAGLPYLCQRVFRPESNLATLVGVGKCELNHRPYRNRCRGFGLCGLRWQEWQRRCTWRLGWRPWPLRCWLQGGRCLGGG